MQAVIRHVSAVSVLRISKTGKLAHHSFVQSQNLKFGSIILALLIVTFFNSVGWIQLLPSPASQW